MSHYFVTSCQKLISFVARRRNGNEAHRNKFIFALTSIGGLGLPKSLPSAGSSASRRREFAHVFSVSFDFLLLGVYAAREQFRGDSCVMRLKKRSLGRKTLR